jgi:DNA-binding CsgD family transcriptional regulator/tetratricopeptide (TPR) repeat protein
MARDAGEVPIIGRTAQVRLLIESFREVEQGDTAAVFVTGDSGVGKTRLIRAATEQMRRSGATVLSGACLDIGDAVPLYALRQALRRFELAAQRSGTPTTAVQELLALLDAGPGGADTAGGLLDRLCRGLSTVSEGRPLVFAVDDLQWADQTTRELVLYLLANLEGIRLLLIAAIRAEALHGTDPLRRMLAELRRLRSVRVLDLAPLDRAQTDELAATIVGRSLAPDDAELVWARSQGNPFLVHELARGAREGRVGLSDTLREIVLSRVDALPRPARAVVHAVAVGAEPVEHALLGPVVRLDEEELIEAARTAVEQRILVAEEDGYRCHHHLIKEVVGTQLLPGERAGLHRRYAEALLEVSGGQAQPARLALHWRLAGERTQALLATIAAAEEAELRYGFAEAFGHWSTALELALPVPVVDAAGGDRRSLLRRAAEAAYRCGEYQGALGMLEELATGTAGAQPCWLRTQRARYLAAAGRPAEAEAEYDRAMAAIGGTARDRAVAAAYSAELLLQLGRYADAGQRAREALELARTVEDSTSSVVLASTALGFSQAYLNDPVAGLAAVEEALQTAERSGSPVDVAGAYLQLAELLTGPLNELERGVVVAHRGAEWVEEVGLGRTYGTRLLAVAANGLFRIGRWADAEEVITAALRHRPSGADAADLLLARCRIWLGYGELDAAEEDLEAVEALLAGGGARQVLPLLTLRAGLAIWRGQYVVAREAVWQGLRPDLLRSDDVWLLAPLVWHGLRAEAEAHATGAGQPDPETVAHLRQVTEQIAASSARAAGPVHDAVVGYQELCDAEIGRLEGKFDPAEWDSAAQVWERRRHPYPAMYARLRQAEALFAQRSRNAEAAAVLRAVHGAAVRLRARPMTEQIEDLARRARVTLQAPAPIEADTVELAPPAARPGGEQRDELSELTAREYEVLAAVAEGRTNREIAKELFISERTVGVHLSHIFGKLQVRSRVQASSVFHRAKRRGG